MADLEQPVEKVVAPQAGRRGGALDNQELVAQKLAKYDLRAVPVLEKDARSVVTPQRLG